MCADSETEMPSKASAPLEEENADDQSGTSEVRTRIMANNKRYEICLHTIIIITLNMYKSLYDSV